MLLQVLISIHEEAKQICLQQIILTEEMYITFSSPLLFVVWP